MTQNQLFLAVAGFLGLALFVSWVSGRRAAARRPVREVTRVGGTVSRSLVSGVVIVGAQWVTLRFDNASATWIALCVPALLAGVTVARLFVVTEIVRSSRREGRR